MATRPIRGRHEEKREASPWLLVAAVVLSGVLAWVAYDAWNGADFEDSKAADLWGD